MATLTLPQAQSAGRHLWMVVGLALLIGAGAGGYALALHEVDALYVGLAAAACIAIMADYRIGAVLLIALLPVSTTSLFPHALMGVTGLNPINVLLAGTLGAYIIRGRLEHPGALVPRPLALLYIAPIAVAALLGTMRVDDIHPDFYDQLVINYNTWTGYIRDALVRPMFTVLAAVLVGAAVAKSRKPESFIAAIAVSACLLAAVMLAFVVISDVRLGYLASARARGFFNEIGTHANELGRVFVTVYALLLFAWWETKNQNAKIGLAVVLSVVSLGLLLTFSRNAFLGFLLVNTLFVVWKFNMKKLGLALLGLMIAAAFAPDAVYRRITYGFESGEANEVAAGRIDGIWLPLVGDLLGSPLWGTGLDSIMWSHAMTSGAMLFVGHPHNAYLQAILDMGLIGLGLLLAYYWHVWKGFRALGSNAYLSPTLRGFFQGACAALLAFALAGLSGGSLRPQPESVPLWMAIGMMYGLLARRPAS